MSSQLAGAIARRLTPAQLRMMLDHRECGSMPVVARGYARSIRARLIRDGLLLGTASPGIKAHSKARGRPRFSRLSHFGEEVVDAALAFDAARFPLQPASIEEPARAVDLEAALTDH